MTTTPYVGMFTDEANSYMSRAVGVVATGARLNRESFAEEFSWRDDNGFMYWNDDKVLAEVIKVAKNFATLEGAAVEFGEATDTAVRESVMELFETLLNGENPSRVHAVNIEGVEIEVHVEMVDGSLTVTVNLTSNGRRLRVNVDGNEVSA